MKKNLISVFKAEILKAVVFLALNALSILYVMAESGKDAFEIITIIKKYF